MFDLDPAFLLTSNLLGELPLCQARLHLDARFPWIVLIPRSPYAREIEDLPADARGQLMNEIVAAGGAVHAVGAALGRPVEKLNIGQLGNVTPQLHVHVIGRRADDPAWPGPVWGHSAPEPYEFAQLAAACAAARDSLGIAEG